MIIILDDEHYRVERFKFHLKDKEVTHVKTANECIAALHTVEKITGLFLDHDLECSRIPDHGNGMDVARWLHRLDVPLSIPWIVIHSLNEPKAFEMRGTLLRRYDNVIRHHSAWEKVQELTALNLGQFTFTDSFMPELDFED